jgi:alkanesulfonate monooxygenase SsuD/methylene tetrahydromethanopterin reductase-like flavin-dependent oxidoreductase (luciferase family)
MTEQTPTRPFRFGIVGGASDLKGWTELARKAEGLGYDTLVSPDPQHDLDPITMLSAAAAVTTTLHVGTFVAVDAFRDRRMLAWQAETLQTLTGGRFELGLGSGRPDAGERAYALSGADYGTTEQRVRRLADTVAYLKRQPVRPPLLLAAAGPRMLALAAREADIVTLAWGPTSNESKAKALVGKLRAAAGDRLADIEVALNLLAAGDKPAPWLERFTGVSTAELLAAKPVTVLPGSPQQGAETLLRWRAELGISYVTINAGFLDELAPVVGLLGNG